MTSAQIGRVLFWMGGALLSFSGLAIAIKLLSGRLTIFEILTIRSSIAVVILLTLAAALPELRDGMRPRFLGTNIVRTSVHFAAQYAWALSLTLLPLATVFALEFTAPVWVALIAVVFLGEKLTATRIGVIVAGLIGVLIILRPGLSAFQPASLLVLGAAMGYAIFFAMTKRLTDSVGTFGIVFWMNLLQFPMGLAGSDPAFPLKLGSADLPAVIGIGITGLTAHYCLTNAFRAGDATLVVPLDFLRLPLIALVGFVFFGEGLDPFVFAGAVIIIAGILWNLRAESRA